MSLIMSLSRLIAANQGNLQNADLRVFITAAPRKFGTECRSSYKMWIILGAPRVANLCLRAGTENAVAKTDEPKGSGESDSSKPSLPRWHFLHW
jgi:hypothetical protein